MVGPTAAPGWLVYRSHPRLPNRRRHLKAAGDSTLFMRIEEHKSLRGVPSRKTPERGTTLDLPGFGHGDSPQ